MINNFDNSIKKYTFSDRLKEALNKRKMTAAELSRKSGVSESNLSRYIKGTYEARQNHLYLLAKALDVNEAWLMGLDVSPERTDWQKANDRLVDITVRLKTDPEFAKLVLLADSLPAEKLPALESVITALLT